MVPWHVILALVAAAVAAGCGTDDGQGGATTAPQQPSTRKAADQLASLPATTVRRCAALAPRRDIRVLCPTRLLKARWYVRHQTLRAGRSEYLTNLDTRPGGSGDPFHVLAGGRRGPFSLKTDDDSWPADPDIVRDLGLVGARPLEPGQRHEEQESVRPRIQRRARVAGHPGLVLRAADYPDGGVHGGHLAVVWNQAQDGYVLSMHFAQRSEYRQGEQHAVLLEAAATMSRFSAGDDR